MTLDHCGWILLISLIYNLLGCSFYCKINYRYRKLYKTDIYLIALRWYILFCWFIVLVLGLQHSDSIFLYSTLHLKLLYSIFLCVLQHFIVTHVFNTQWFLYLWISYPCVASFPFSWFSSSVSLFLFCYIGFHSFYCLDSTYVQCLSYFTKC